MSTEQFREFAGAVLRSLPDDLETSVAQGWIGNQESLRRVLREALSPNGKPAGRHTFSITCEGAEASELVRLGNYDWSDEWITDERFPMKKHKPVDRTVELIEFDHDPTSEEVLEELTRRGLERPTYEDAFYFGIQHPEEQRGHPVVFLHERVLDPYGLRFVLVLREYAGERLLFLRWFDVRWFRSCAFAGVRK